MLNRVFDSFETDDFDILLTGIRTKMLLALTREAD
jgi:hypothetical protein